MSFVRGKLLGAQFTPPSFVTAATNILQIRLHALTGWLAHIIKHTNEAFSLCSSSRRGRRAGSSSWCKEVQTQLQQQQRQYVRTGSFMPHFLNAGSLSQPGKQASGRNIAKVGFASAHEGAARPNVTTRSGLAEGTDSGLRAGEALFERSSSVHPRPATSSPWLLDMDLVSRVRDGFGVYGTYNWNRARAHGGERGASGRHSL